MKVINLFAEAGAGKSTTAAGLFFLMKCAGYHVELATEYAKDLVHEERTKTFNDQLYITAKQNHKLFLLNNKYDYAITDSPLLLGLVYRQDDCVSYFDDLVFQLFNSYENVNILLTRSKPYKQIGRNQTEEESKKIRENILQMLNYYNLDYYSVVADDKAPHEIFYRLKLDKF
jgi:ABC-type oligopeptide transport system ATPase subunit